ncbi:MAG: hypothetical protein JRG73_20945, partial [Deltaproteobacteria bacterium]|nr:hypothetical protein [Deltaproteobacteria bacterium]
MNALLRTKLEDEIFQVIFRIRPLQDPSKKIVILTDYPVEAIPAPVLVSMEEFLGRKPRGYSRVKDVVEALLSNTGFTSREVLVSGYGDGGCMCHFYYIKYIPPELAHAHAAPRTVGRYYPQVVGDLNLHEEHIVIKYRDGDRWGRPHCVKIAYRSPTGRSRERPHHKAGHFFL